MMIDSVENVLIELESQEIKIKELFKNANVDVIYQMDFITNALLDRALHLIFGFTKLIRDENYIAASHLVRCHLDNILRYSAFWLVENPQELAIEIMNGKKLDRIKDKNGKFLRDYYLKEKMNENYPWVTNVYNESSGFIHFSKKHIFTSSRLSDKENRTVEFKLSKKDNFVPEISKIEATKCMIEISNILFDYVEVWIETKQIIKLKTQK